MKQKLLHFVIGLLPFLTAAQIQFSPYVEIPTGSWASVVAIGDVNNDGLKDVVVGAGYYFDADNDYKINVFLQNNMGFLNSPIKYSYPVSYPGLKTIDIADFNNDNRNDVIIGYDTKVGIFYQNSGGTLNAVNEIQVGQAIYSLKAADLSNDGLADFAVSCASGGAMKVFFQQPGGIFNPVNYASPSYSYTEIHIADMNVDGKNDIICMTGTNTVNVFFQNTTGTFNGFIPNSSTSINGIAVGDLNNDGRPDIAASKGGNSPSAKIVLWMQNPATSLMNAPSEIAAYDIPEPIEIADLNNDGKNEIVAAHGGWNGLTVYQQNPVNYNSYTLFPIPYASHYEEQGMAIGDVNNDGRKDVAIADYGHGLVILYNTTTLDIAPNEFQKSINVYPNPAGELLNIDLVLGGKFEVEIYNMVGRQVSKATGEVSLQLNTSDLASGIYLLKIRAGDGNLAIKKFIKA
jgi:hypothetical protein